MNTYERKTLPTQKLLPWVMAMLGSFILMAFSVIPTAHSATATNATVDQFNDQIDSKKTEIDKIKRRIELYQQRIAETQKQALTLKNQLKLIENEIAKTGLDIELTTSQIAKTNLEIQRTTNEIAAQQDRIATQRQRIRRLLQIIYQNDQISYLEVMLTNETFSDFFDYYQRLQGIQEQLQRSVNKLKVLHAELELQQTTLVNKKNDEEKLKTTLEQQRQDLREQSVNQATVLQETQKSEKKFSSYVQELKAEQQQINQDIVSIEKKIRDEIARQKEEADRIAALGIPRLRWPTNGRYITSYFHDPEYPYRNIFEHPAIDIRAPQGSAVYSAEAGYVGKVKNGGANGYSYLLVIHNDGISTLYGHVSAFEVGEGQMVTKGQIIARSGGTPGTRGAGRMTSGPHLHFEVRVNGLPQNPLDYLPSK